MPGPWEKYQAPGAAAPPDAGGPWQRYGVAPPAATPQPDITANPNGEGTYKMAGRDGKPVSVPFSNVEHALTKGGYTLDRSDLQRYQKDFAASPQPGSESSGIGLGSIAKGAGNEILGFGKGLKEIFAPDHQSALETMAGPVAPLVRIAKGVYQAEKKSAHQVKQYTDDTNATPWSSPGLKLLSAARAGTTALSMANPLNPGGTAGLNEQIDAGHNGEAMGAGLVDSAMIGGPLGLKWIGRGAKGVLAGDVDKPMPGTDLTPRQRYEDAKSLGVELPAAQATNSKVLKPIDWVNRSGLLSEPTYESQQRRNMTSLTSATDDMLQRLSPHDPESGGAAIQQPLRGAFVDLQNKAHDGLGEMSPLEGSAGGSRLQGLAQSYMDDQHNTATQGYKDIQEKYGSQPAKNAAAVSQTAQRLIDKNKRFSSQMPSLVSRKLDNVLGDAAGLGSDDQVKQIGAPTVSDLMRGRSALLDLTRDPEIVKSSSLADIQQLIAAHDSAITDSLPPEGQDAWRDANGTWESMKKTFDSPQSPYYHALRTPNPSNLTTGIGGNTPESVQQLRKIGGDEGVGIVQRGVADKLLGRTGTGEYDLRGYGARLERTPEEFRDELFGGDKHEDLRRIASDYSEMQPFEKAANTENPEELVHGKGLGPQTAAGVRKLRDYPMPDGMFGPAKPRVGEEGMGALRRGVATDLIGKNSEDGYNFKTLPNKLTHLNEGYRDELFGDEHETLKKIANTSKALDVDYNRSGSGKLGQKVIEGAKMSTGVPLIQIPLAKILTSPRFTDWLMKPASKSRPLFVSPAAGRQGDANSQ